ncbi:TetR/AcrR family transcriptional regulator; helix-turn-helix transcriptional regulator [Sphingobium sufflavum]|uniref:TetR/AcrR family transcriptional regulator n=1 Tax=Sphingobium sufflavum TaxID=1129547 RepID=UPI001F3F1491|nr:TetR/AcrR family transcriptional regulator [Sphingobium sufflavum]MCE7798861.1 TetR/AcrR family transcriptional regulator; helix-turn-helix transcriptional regulator [Sphingobium sufflavum]
MTEEKAPATGARATRSLAALRAALLTLLESKQFDDITIKDIVTAADIGQATFYRHYSTKAALLEAVAATEIETFVGMAVSILGSTGEQSSAVALARYVHEHRTLWSALLSGGAAGAMREGFIRQVDQAYSGIDEKPDTWVPRELGIVFSVTATVEIIAWWLRQPNDVPITRIAEILDGLAIQPTLVRHTTAEKSAPKQEVIKVSIDARIRWDKD